MAKLSIEINDSNLPVLRQLNLSDEQLDIFELEKQKAELESQLAEINERLENGDQVPQ